MRMTTFFQCTLIGLVGLSVAAQAAPETFGIDGAHSMVFFKVKHMNLSYTYGLFPTLEGQFQYDKDDPTNNSVTVSIKAATIYTGNAKRDEHLKGPDFFNVRQFPIITFKSTSVKKAGEGGFEAKGNLTLHGVTKPIVVKLEQTGTGEARGTTVMGFEGQFQIKRSDFGMDKMLSGVGNEVTLRVTIEGHKK